MFGPDASPALASAKPDDDQLEAEADRLLWQEGRPCTLEYSFHREATLVRADQGRREPPLPPGPVTCDASDADDLLGVLLEALLSEAALWQRHRRVLSLARRGLTMRQIATAMGVREQTARRWRDQALARLQAYCERHTASEAARNLEEAYREQLRLGSPTEECHCAPGREACQRDGLCKYRWYLRGQG